MRVRLNEKSIPLLATAVVCIALFAAGSMRYRGFFSARNAINLPADNAFIGVVAVGMTFVILSGGIDLSVGSMVALTGVLIGAGVTRHGLHPGVVVPAVLLFGTLFGGSMGLLIHASKLPPFLVTLAGMFLARGIGYVISQKSFSIDHPWYDRLSAAQVPLGDGLGLPLMAVIFFVVLAAGIYLAHATRFGRAVYAIGGNEQSAALMGLPVGRTKVLVYALSGFCAALGGVVSTLYSKSGDPRAAIALELDAIAAVVIGGTLLSGGVGYVIGTFFGVIILGIIQLVPSFEGDMLSSSTRIAIGFLLFVFIALQKLIVHVSARGAAGVSVH